MKSLFFIIIACIVLISLYSAFNTVPYQQNKWQLQDISGHLPDLQFSLLADDGKPVTASDYKGKVILIYFGFTNCPDECPVTLSRITQLMQSLGKDAGSVQAP